LKVKKGVKKPSQNEELKYKWASIPLTYLGDSSTADSLDIELKKAFKKGKPRFFIPKFTEKDVRHEKDIVLFPGYVFVNRVDPKEFNALNDNAYFNSPIAFNRQIAFMPEVEIQKMRRKLRRLKSHDLWVGHLVRVEDGIYKNMEGEVVAVEDNDVVMVHLVLASKEIMAKVSPSFLTRLD